MKHIAILLAFLMTLSSPVVATDKEWVSYQEGDFTSSSQQNTLIYHNASDSVQGRSLFDRDDVSSDYQIHAIYLLASDSKDKRMDINGKIESIITKGNKHLKRIINKELKYDLTIQRKLDVSFLRVNKTIEEIQSLENYALNYFGNQLIKNGFYHPKKIYTIFYQENYFSKELNRNLEGVQGLIKFETPKGSLEIPIITNYLSAAPSDLWFVNFHEIIHGLSFIQECSPNHKEHHVNLIDAMSGYDSGQQLIDINSQDYYGHSNADCPLDLKKSVFLYPTEKSPQLIPYDNDCNFDRNVRKYDGSVALNCLKKLNFVSSASAFKNGVLEAQMLLTLLGYDPGPMDGVLGSKTKSAFKSFISKNEVKWDGQFNNTALNYLRDASRD